MANAVVLSAVPSVLHGRPILVEAQGPRGAIRVVSPADGVTYGQTLGHLDEGLATKIRDATLDAWKQGGVPLTVFVDWSAMASYDAAARQLLTQMVLQHRDAFRNVLVLTGSTVVSIGVSTAGLATALVGVTVNGTTDRAHFLAQLARHVG